MSQKRIGQMFEFNMKLKSVSGNSHINKFHSLQIGHGGSNVDVLLINLRCFFIVVQFIRTDLNRSLTKEVKYLE